MDLVARDQRVGIKAETRPWNKACGSFNNILNPKIAHCVLKMQTDVLRRDSRTAFQCFKLCDCPSVVLTAGACRFPSLMEHSPLQSGVMALSQVEVSSFQYSNRKTGSQFNASYSSIRCQNRKRLTVHRSARHAAVIPKWGHCSVVLLRCAGKERISLVTMLRGIPSRRMFTCLEACFSFHLLQWWHQTPARSQGVSWGGPQLSNRFLQDVRRMSSIRNARGEPAEASDRQFWAWRALAFSLSRLQMLTYFQSLDLPGVQQDPWTPHWRGSRCPGGEPFWAASAGADEYLRYTRKKGGKKLLSQLGRRTRATSPLDALTDMINSTRTELSVELLGTEAPEVLDCKGPEVQHIVPWEGVSLLQQDHFGPQESQFDGCAQAAWSSTND